MVNESYIETEFLCKAKKKENPVLQARPTAFSPFAQFFFFTPKNCKISHFLNKNVNEKF